MAWNDKIGLPESRRKSNLCGACVSVWCCGMCCDLGCCVPLTCQFAVELLQEAGLSGVAGEKSKADWVGTRLMVDLCLCGGWVGGLCEELHERVVGIPVQSLHAPSKNLDGSSTSASQKKETCKFQQQFRKHFSPFARYHGHDCSSVKHWITQRYKSTHFAQLTESRPHGWPPCLLLIFNAHPFKIQLLASCYQCR